MVLSPLLITAVNSDGVAVVKLEQEQRYPVRPSEWIVIIADALYIH